jgi:hypothetical protein
VTLLVGLQGLQAAECKESVMKEKPTEAQLTEIRRLSKEARMPDQSVIVTSKEEAETRIRDLKEKARVE